VGGRPLENESFNETLRVDYTEWERREEKRGVETHTREGRYRMEKVGEGNVNPQTLNLKCRRWSSV
jgi:hypothetical protein